MELFLSKMPEDGEGKKAVVKDEEKDGAKSDKNFIDPEQSNKTNAVVIQTNENQEYGESPYRWYVLVAYCLCVFANGFQWVTFSAIATQFEDKYGVSSWRVNMFSLIYMIIYPFVCIPEGWLVDGYSTRLGINIAAGCTLAGSALKLLVNKDTSLASCYVGQILNGLFQPALLNSPGKIAANWFREDVRTIICTIGCLADTVGIFVGFLWNIPFIHEYEKVTNEVTKKFKDEVFNYMLSEFILNVVFCIPAFFILKDKPNIPPSPSQNVDETKKVGLIDSLRLLFTNIRFVYLLLSTLFVVGYYDVMGTIINSLFDKYAVTGQQSSVIYAVSSIVGMVVSIIISYLLDKFKKFKLFMIILCIAGTVFQALFTFLLEIADDKNLNQYAIGLVLYSLINAAVVPFYTIGMNYACEITYPVGESITGGIMMTMSQLSGIGGTFLCDHFIQNYDKKWISNVILLAFFVIACVFVFLFDEKLVRSEVDEAGKKDKDVNSKNKDERPQIEAETIGVRKEANMES